jgi:pimeloyl-ACP methyl ester carboxylesterase
MVMKCSGLALAPGPRPGHRSGGAAAAPSITVPTLLMRGLRSELVSERRVQALHEVIPHATRLDVAEADRMIVGDRNDAFTAALVSYPRRLRADPRAVGG